MPKPDRPLPAASTPQPATYDAYFRSAVQAALDDATPGIPHEKVKHDFAIKRAALLTRQTLK